jgi:hypothetical protein
MGGVAMTILENVVRGLAQDQWRKVRNARLKLVLCRLMIDIMRTVHGAYTPAGEPFRARLEIFFIALCVAIGDIEGKPFSSRQDCRLHARTPYYRHTQARPAAKLGPRSIAGAATITCSLGRKLGLVLGPRAFCGLTLCGQGRADTQFPHRYAELPTGAAHS